MCTAFTISEGFGSRVYFYIDTLESYSSFVQGEVQRMVTENVALILSEKASLSMVLEKGWSGDFQAVLSAASAAEEECKKAFSRYDRIRAEV